CCKSFFFQAEDGIRDGHVTGVQTCALPICTQKSAAQISALRFHRCNWSATRRRRALIGPLLDAACTPLPASKPATWRLVDQHYRSEERRVGKGGRAQWGWVW